MEKMWAGRFAKELNKEADDFNSSIHFDCKMYKQDITGSMKHATMLAMQKIITDDDCDKILAGRYLTTLTVVHLSSIWTPRIFICSLSPS